MASLLSEEVRIERTEATEDEEGCVSIEKAKGFEMPKEKKERRNRTGSEKRTKHIANRGRSRDFCSCFCFRIRSCS
jgi:peptide deformylase